MNLRSFLKMGVVFGGVEIVHWSEEECVRVFSKCVQAPAAVVTDIVEFARTKLGFEPDEKQAEVLRSTAKRGILNCSRQWGKTTALALKVVHRMFTEPKILILVASPSYRQTHEFMMRAKAMVSRLGIPIRGDGENKHSLVFPNGSRVVGLPHMPDTARSFSSLSMLIFDEAAFVSNEMFNALLPMIAVRNGELWLLSTPHGKTGFFYDIWQHGGDLWHRISVKATDCSRIPAEFLEEMRSARGDDYVRQEFLCEFLGSGSHAFDRDLVERALDSSVEPFSSSVLATREDGLKTWLTGRPDSWFYVAVDLGKRRDHSSIVILEWDGQQMLVRSVERVPLGTPYERVVEMVRKVVGSPKLAGRCTLVVDGSGVGEVVMEMFRRAELGCRLTAVTITGGSVTRPGKTAGYTNVPKFELMSALHVALEREELKIAKRMKEVQALMREFLSVRVKENGSMGAEGGEHDDLVMGVALACWAAKRKKNDWGGGGAVS
jgi:hypothetical protein